MQPPPQKNKQKKTNKKKQKKNKNITIPVNTEEGRPSVVSLSKFPQLYHRLAAVVQTRCQGCMRL